jgi:hypothetical protein
MPLLTALKTTLILAKKIPMIAIEIISSIMLKPEAVPFFSNMGKPIVRKWRHDLCRQIIEK